MDISIIIGVLLWIISTVLYFVRTGYFPILKYPGMDNGKSVNWVEALIFILGFILFFYRVCIVK